MYSGKHVSNRHTNAHPRWWWCALLVLPLAGCGDDATDDSAGSATSQSSTATNGGTSSTSGAPTSSTSGGPGTAATTAGSGMGSSTSAGQTTGSDACNHDQTIQPIWDANCVTGCHDPGGTWSLLQLTPGDAVSNIVGGLSTQSPLSLIEPNDRQASYLWHKIRGTHLDVQGSGQIQPPPPAPPLSEDDIAAIEEWIDCGAPG